MSERRKKVVLASLTVGIGSLGVSVALIQIKLINIENFTVFGEVPEEPAATTGPSAAEEREDPERWLLVSNYREFRWTGFRQTWKAGEGFKCGTAKDAPAHRDEIKRRCDELYSMITTRYRWVESYSLYSILDVDTDWIISILEINAIDKTQYRLDVVRPGRVGGVELPFDYHWIPNEYWQTERGRKLLAEVRKSRSSY